MRPHSGLRPTRVVLRGHEGTAGLDCVPLQRSASARRDLARIDVDGAVTDLHGKAVETDRRGDPHVNDVASHVVRERVTGIAEPARAVVRNEVRAVRRDTPRPVKTLWALRASNSPWSRRTTWNVTSMFSPKGATEPGRKSSRGPTWTHRSASGHAKLRTAATPPAVNSASGEQRECESEWLCAHARHPTTTGARLRWRSTAEPLKRSSVPASGVTEVDVEDHRIILHEGLKNVEDDGGHGKRELVGAAAQAGGRG